MTTLLDKAMEATTKGRPIKNQLTDEHFELARAWAMGDIGISAVSRALGTGSAGSYVYMARALREIVGGRK